MRGLFQEQLSAIERGVICDLELAASTLAVIARVVADTSTPTPSSARRPEQGSCRAISTSACPAPTVSTKIISLPNASSTRMSFRVAAVAGQEAFVDGVVDHLDALRAGPEDAQHILAGGLRDRSHAGRHPVDTDVGGGREARRGRAALVGLGARVVVVAAQVDPGVELGDLAAQRRIVAVGSVDKKRPVDPENSSSSAAT